MQPEDLEEGDLFSFRDDLKGIKDLLRNFIASVEEFVDRHEDAEAAPKDQESQEDLNAHWWQAKQAQLEFTVIQHAIDVKRKMLEFEQNREMSEYERRTLETTEKQVKMAEEQELFKSKQRQNPKL